MAEVADDELALLRRSHATFAKLWDDPTHGLAIKRATKAIDPSVRVPEIDVAEPMIAPLREELTAKSAALDALAAKYDTLEQRLNEDRQVADLERDRATAQTKYRLTDAAMGEAMGLIRDGKATSFDGAAAYIVANLEPAAPMTGSNFGPSDANVLGIDGSADDESTKRLHTDPLKWLDHEVPRILSEFEQAA